MKNIKLLGLLVALLSLCVVGQEAAKSKVAESEKVDSKNNAANAETDIQSVVSSSDSAELINITPESIDFLKFTNAKEAIGRTTYETIANGRIILRITPLRLTDRDDLVKSLDSIHKGEHSLGFMPTFAIRCFKGYDYSLMLISPHDFQARILDKKGEHDPQFVSAKFCEILNTINRK